MDSDEFALVNALMEQNEDMRVIAVGDDDQNIYAFRGADSKYLEQFISEKQATKHELIENYRSKNNLVEIIEAIDHPFMLASQFHPEFKSRPNRPHPMFDGFVAATLVK